MEDRLFENLGNRETNDSVRAVLGIITPLLSYYRREMAPKSLKIGTFFPESAADAVAFLFPQPFGSGAVRVGSQHASLRAALLDAPRAWGCYRTGDTGSLNSAQAASGLVGPPR